MGYIYKIVNNINKKIYVGKTTKSIGERFEAHIKNAKRHINRYLYDAMNHYGYDNFSVEQVEECLDEKLDEREKYWISFYNSIIPNGYNMTSGGEGGDTWSCNPHKIETSKKLSRVLREISAKKQGYKSFQDKLDINNINGFEDKDFDLDIFVQKVQSGKSLDDISRYFGLSGGCLRRKWREEIGIPMKEFRPLDFCMNGDVRTDGNYKAIDRNSLLEMIKNNKNNKDICTYFNITNQTLRNKCIELFSVPIELLRDETYTMHTPEVREKISKSRLGKTYEEIYGLEEGKRLSNLHTVRWQGDKNPNFKYVDKEILYNMIYSDATIEEMTAYFNISKPTLYSKIKEYFNLTLREVRKDVRNTEKSCSH